MNEKFLEGLGDVAVFWVVAFSIVTGGILAATAVFVFAREAFYALKDLLFPERK